VLVEVVVLVELEPLYGLRSPLRTPSPRDARRKRLGSQTTVPLGEAKSDVLTGVIANRVNEKGLFGRKIILGAACSSGSVLKREEVQLQSVAATAGEQQVLPRPCEPPVVGSRTEVLDWAAFFVDLHLAKRADLPRKLNQLSLHHAAEAVSGGGLGGAGLRNCDLGAGQPPPPRSPEFRRLRSTGDANHSTSLVRGSRGKSGLAPSSSSATSSSSRRASSSSDR